MARLVILGAGISGQTAALHAKKRVGKRHEIIVISPNSKWNWIPSNIWVGIGKMKPEDVTFELKPVYKKAKIPFIQAKAVSIHPEGNQTNPKPFVKIEMTEKGKEGEEDIVEYDFLLNATGPKLKFEATEGLGPDKNSLSVCTYSHAEETAKKLDELIAQMEKGEEKTLLIGTGHGTCTCQGAAFEYIFNVEHQLRQKKVRDMARIIWISNEQELGDFGMGGMHIKRGGYVTHSKVFTESLFAERGVEWITRAHVKKVDNDEVLYETLEGEEKSVKHDFAMLLPPFSGVGLKAFDKNDSDITDVVFAPNGFMKVDADYSKKPYEEWEPEDWPKTYQNPTYSNLFAVGIAFAPPHAISQPKQSVNGTPISPTPPRTGMPSGVMAREVVFSIIDMMDGKADKPTREASMAKMGAACIASAGANVINGTAVSMTMYPIIPDFKSFPETGRDLNYTTGEIGLAGHWIKHLLHFAFIYKAKANPFWRIIPE
ncbi:MAG: sulfide:quinone reductase [Melioribacteraceae bacterium]|nr:MAG: sulfide:quinone reductase [Melioribacteraceae bacterium]